MRGDFVTTSKRTTSSPFFNRARARYTPIKPRPPVISFAIFSFLLNILNKVGNPSVMGSSNTNAPLYPSFEKRGKGRFSQHNFKIPLYPPLPKGDKNTRN
jgi:hypothetical protein